MKCSSEREEIKVDQVRQLEEKQEEIVKMSKIEDLKSLRSTTLVFYLPGMKESPSYSQPFIKWEPLKKICDFLFLRQNFEGSAVLKWYGN